MGSANREYPDVTHLDFETPEDLAKPLHAEGYRKVSVIWPPICIICGRSLSPESTKFIGFSMSRIKTQRVYVYFQCKNCFRSFYSMSKKQRENYTEKIIERRLKIFIDILKRVAGG